MDLKKELTRYVTENRLTFSYEVVSVQNYISFFEALDNSTIDNSDIFIIDIQLNTYFTGIDFGKKIRQINQNCFIVYLTSLANKAVDVINENISPNAYLLKSYDPEVIQFQLVDLFQNLELNELSKKSLLVFSHGSQIRLYYSDILYITTRSGFRNKLLVQTIGTEVIITGTISKIKSELTSPPFHLNLKSIIINDINIKSLSSATQTITFKNNIELEQTSRLINKLIKYRSGDEQ